MSMLKWKILVLFAFLCVSVFAATTMVSFYQIARPNEALGLRNGSHVALDIVTSEPLMPIDNPGGG